MSQPEQKIKATQPEAGSAAKKPYSKPEVRYEQVFETSALACGKVQASNSQCQHNRKS